MKKYLFIAVFCLLPIICWAENKQLQEITDFENLITNCNTEFKTPNVCQNNNTCLKISQKNYEDIIICYKNVLTTILQKKYSFSASQAIEYANKITDDIKSEFVFLLTKSKYCKGKCEDWSDLSHTATEIEIYINSILDHLTANTIKQKTYSELIMEYFSTSKYRIYSKAVEKNKKQFKENICRDFRETKCVSQNLTAIETLKKYYFIHLRGILAYYYEMDKNSAQEFAANLWNKIYQRSLFIFTDGNIIDEDIFSANLDSLMFLNRYIYTIQYTLHHQKFIF